MANRFLALKQNKITWIVLFGLVIRVLFYFLGAKIYYGKANFMVGGDTSSWVDSFRHLINRGSYASTFQSPNGFFYRPPGYSFFFGFFYLLSGQKINLAYKLVVWAQIIMDTASIWLIYKITIKSLNRPKAALLASFLYAIYPFSIVWTAIVYAETSSIFFMILSIYFLFQENKKWNYIWSGVFLGIAVLTRLQIFLLFPVVCITLILYYKENTRGVILKHLFLYIISFSLMYGLWPARNYFLHDRLLFTQDLSASDCWDVDVLSFREYMFSIKSDIYPQFDDILYGRKTTFPKDAYIIKGDSEKLAEAVTMCHRCGKGFSVFMKNEKLRKQQLFNDSSCSKEIAQIYNGLKENQIKYNAMNYYLWVPLKNVKKAFFKFALYKPSSPMVGLLSELLFLFRTIMIFLGLLGVIVYICMNRKMAFIHSVIVMYFLIWYFYNCFIYRNMEIRYLLQGDLLLLIPAGYLIEMIIGNFKRKDNISFQKRPDKFYKAV